VVDGGWWMDVYYSNDDGGDDDHDVQLRPSALFIDCIRNQRCYTTCSGWLTDDVGYTWIKILKRKERRKKAG